MKEQGFVKADTRNSQEVNIDMIDQFYHVNLQFLLDESRNFKCFGPAMRPHDMYMIQQPRGVYSRQQGGSSSLESTLQSGSNEWRHVVMSQQQNINFDPQVRSCFKDGFTVDRNNLQHMASQHQQLRTQQIPFRGSNLSNQQNMQQCLGQVFEQGGGHMNLNQQMIPHMQQQQNIMQQTNQMPGNIPGNIRMQQSQSLAMSSQPTHQSNLLHTSVMPANIRMQQSQSIIMSNQSMHQSNMVNNSVVSTPPSSHNTSLSNFTGQPFLDNLEFFDNLPTTDSTSFTEQELLNSFDSDCGFNLDF